MTMAIEYASSPVEQPGTQIRTGSPGFWMSGFGGGLCPASV